MLQAPIDLLAPHIYLVEAQILTTRQPDWPSNWGRIKALMITILPDTESDIFFRF
jgi:hypothetical protein